MNHHEDYVPQEPCLRCGKDTDAPAYCPTCLPLERVDAQIRIAKRAVDQMRKDRGMDRDDHMGWDDVERHRLEVESDDHQRG